MTVTKDETGRANIWAIEPEMYISKEDSMRDEYETHADRAEKLNGRFAMMGIIAALGAYAVSGQIIPGVW